MLGTKEHVNILGCKLLKPVLFCIVLVVFEHSELFLSFLLSPATSVSFVLFQLMDCGQRSHSQSPKISFYFNSFTLSFQIGNNSQLFPTTVTVNKIVLEYYIHTQKHRQLGDFQGSLLKFAICTAKKVEEVVKQCLN